MHVGHRAPKPAARDYAATLAYYRAHPAAFALDVLGVTPWRKQCAILESVRINRRTAVRACRGVGKTFIAAVIVIWFLCCFGPGAKVITTAPTQHQVDNMLWANIRALVAKAEERGFSLGATPTKNRFEFDPDWYAVGLSSNDPDRYLGFHATAILFLVDEASGVPQAILDAAKGYGTGAISRTLYIGNGTQTSGGLYDAFTGDAELWERIGVSMFDSPNFTEDAVARFPRVKAYMEGHGIPYSTETVPEHVARELPNPEVVDEALIEWGPEHPLFAVFVLGEFPGEGANSVIGLRAAMEAQARFEEWEPTEGVTRSDVAADIARFGDDETAIGIRDHGDIDRLRTHTVVQGQDLMRTAGAIVRACRDVIEEQRTPGRIVVDDAGVGGGVVDRLRELQREGAIDPRWEIIAFNGGNRPRDRRDYPNARSEAWFTFSEALARVALEPDPRMLADLVAPTYELDSAGRRVVEQKKVTKKRLGRSPDRADMALMAFAPKALSVKGRRSKGSVYG